MRALHGKGHRNVSPGSAVQGFVSLTGVGGAGHSAHLARGKQRFPGVRSRLISRANGRVGIQSRNSPSGTSSFPPPCLQDVGT